MGLKLHVDSPPGSPSRRAATVASRQPNPARTGTHTLSSSPRQLPGTAPRGPRPSADATIAGLERQVAASSGRGLAWMTGLACEQLTSGSETLAGQVAAAKLAGVLMRSDRLEADQVRALHAAVFDPAPPAELSVPLLRRATEADTRVVLQEIASVGVAELPAVMISVGHRLTGADVSLSTQANAACAAEALVNSGRLSRAEERWLLGALQAATQPAMRDGVRRNAAQEVRDAARDAVAGSPL